MKHDVDLFDYINMIFDAIALYTMSKSLFNLFYDLARHDFSIIADAI